MKALLTIGCVRVLLPDIKTATQVLHILSQGVEVRDHMFMNTLKIIQQPLEVGVRSVPENVKQLTETSHGDEDVEKAPFTKPNPSKPAPRRRLGGRSPRLLTFGENHQDGGKQETDGGNHE